ncbi:hypothetical protein ACFOG5_19305 [Pedobacter fastidiosus]|uniref:hypothetical protein n=1 Tax=Pedobacter fastidiosus TaxID=2765361 RepID=UPI003612A60D
MLDTIDTLETFVVAQIDDADETEANHFQSCVLTIEDDKRRKFATKYHVIIRAVVQFVNSMCKPFGRDRSRYNHPCINVKCTCYLAGDLFLLSNQQQHGSSIYRPT